MADPDFDIGHHLHRVALPSPGDDAELFKMVATLIERRLDRDRPLWECWVIEGLAQGRWAILTKLHHCIADGIAAAQLLANLSGGATGDSFVTDIHASAQPETVSERPARVSLNPVNWVSGLLRASVGAVNAAGRAAVGAAELTAGVLSETHDTSLTGPVTKMRRYSAARVAMADMQSVCRAFGVTLNDVALAAIADSYRNVLLARGERPHRDSLRTLVPVSVRTVSALDQPDNRVSAMLPLLPVDEADPVKRLLTVHSRLNKAKGSGQREGARRTVRRSGPDPVRLVGVDHSAPDQASATQRRRIGDQRSGSARPPAGNGSRGARSATRAADRPGVADRHRDGELRRHFRVRHHRRL